MREIIPAILTDDFPEFSRQLKKLEKIFAKIQIDVMDGKFVSHCSFPETDKLKRIFTPAKFELHLMVQDPLAELNKWSEVKNIFRVIFHLESTDRPEMVIATIKKFGWQAGVAINPETAWLKAAPLFPHVSEILFLTVHPGQQGAQFQDRVIKKIKRFSREKERPLCGADGGINADNIRELAESGVEIFNIGSALTMAEHPELIYQKLINLME